VVASLAVLLLWMLSIRQNIPFPNAVTTLLTLPDFANFIIKGFEMNIRLICKGKPQTCQVVEKDNFEKISDKVICTSSGL
jgi:hypothetical protein